MGHTRAMEIKDHADIYEDIGYVSNVRNTSVPDGISGVLLHLDLHMPLSCPAFLSRSVTSLIKQLRHKPPFNPFPHTHFGPSSSDSLSTRSVSFRIISSTELIRHNTPCLKKKKKHHRNDRNRINWNHPSSENTQSDFTTYFEELMLGLPKRLPLRYALFLLRFGAATLRRAFAVLFQEPHFHFWKTHLVGRNPALWLVSPARLRHSSLLEVFFLLFGFSRSMKDVTWLYRFYSQTLASEVGPKVRLRGRTGLRERDPHMSHPRGRWLVALFGNRSKFCRVLILRVSSTCGTQLSLTLGGSKQLRFRSKAYF